MADSIASTYEIKQKLGAGGGGEVYLARHIRLDKDVVLKIDKRELSTPKELLKREVDTLKNLKHAHIPQVYDFFEENNKVYTVIDYVPGESLDRPLKRREHFSQPQVIKWARQLLDALAYLHSPTHGDPPKGYVHSDIKPANLMKTPDGDIYLIDFNIALAVGEENVIGMSFGYASPEHYGLDYSFSSTDNEESSQTGKNSGTQGKGIFSSLRKKTAQKQAEPVPEKKAAQDQMATHMESGQDRPAPAGNSRQQPGADRPGSAGDGKTYLSSPENKTFMETGPRGPAPDGGTVLERKGLGGEEGNTVLERKGPGGEEGNTVLERKGPGGEEGNTVLERKGPGGEEGNTVPERQGPGGGGETVLEKGPASIPMKSGEPVPTVEETVPEPKPSRTSGSSGKAPDTGKSSERPGSAPKPAASTGTASKQRKIVPDVRSDIYSVGATLYHLLSGVRPAKDAKEVIPLSPEDFSPLLIEIISKAMNPNPDLRYQTAAEMLEAFDRLYTDDPRTRKLKKQVWSTYAVLSVLLASGILTSFVGLKRIQTAESQLKLVEYSKNALAEGDAPAAIGYALEALPARAGLLTPAAPASAKAALADALGVYDLRDSYRPDQVLELPAAPLFLSAAPDGSSLACITAAGLSVYETESCRLIASLPAERSALSEVRYLDSHTVLFAGSEGLSAYDLSKGDFLWTGEPATAIRLSADGSCAAAVYKDEPRARIYRTADGTLLSTVDFSGRAQSVVTNDLAANPNDSLLALNGDGSKLAVSFDGGGLYVFDTLSGKEVCTVYETSEFTHFEGGFSGPYLAFSATGDGTSVFGIVDTVDVRQTGGFSSTMPFLVQADENGIWVATENVLVKIDPESGEQEETAYTESDIIRFYTAGDHTILSSEDGRFSFFGPMGSLLAAYEGEFQSHFLTLAGPFAAAGSRDSPQLRLLRLEDRSEAQLLAYDPAYEHSEARLSAGSQTVMLFSFDSFRIYGTGGELLVEAEIPDAGQVYDQQFRREGEESWLEVTYNSGLVRNYSARDGSLLSETQGEPPDGSFREEYLTDRLRIEAPLHGTPVAYDLHSGKQVAELEPDAYLTYVTQVGDCVMTEYTTAQGERYGLLLNEKCEVLARMPELCDILPDGTLLFDDMLGNLRQSRIYSIDELISLAKK